MRRRRRRIRIQRHEDDRPLLNTALKSSSPAAVNVREAEPPEVSYGDLSPTQMHILNLQQTSGNQAVMRYIQRAKSDRDEAEAVSDNADVAEVVEDTDGKDPETGVAPESEDALQLEAVSLYRQASAAYMEKKYHTALQTFRESRALYDHPNTTFWMAMCEMRLDEYEFALLDMQDAMDDPRLDQSALKRGATALEILKLLRDSHAQGILPLPAKTDDIESDIGKEPRALRNEAGRFYMAAEAAYKSEDYGAARNAFEISYRRLPHPMTLLNLAKCLILMREYDRARTAVEKAVRDPRLTGQGRKIGQAILEQARKMGNVSIDLVSPPPD